jgi:hypothetical protein
MSDTPPEEERLSEELRRLGKNLFGILQAAWDHPERKRVQNEIENGLRDLSVSLQQEAGNFSKSSTGEKIKAEIDDIGTRISSGETTSKIYEDLISALKVANAELSSAINRIGQEEKPAETTGAENSHESSG